MDNEKRALLAIVLSLLVLFIYQYFFAPPPKKVPVKPGAAPQETAPQEKISPSAPPDMKPAPPPALAEAAKPDVAERAAKTAVITTPLYTAVFSHFEAGLTSFRLHRYMDSLGSPAVIKLVKKMFSAGETQPEPQPQWKELIHLGPAQHLPLRAFFLTAQGRIIEDSQYQSSRDALEVTAQSGPSSITFTPDSTAAVQDLRLEKTFKFTPADYRIDVAVTLRNTATTAVDGNAVVEWTHYYPSRGEHSGGGFFGGSQSSETMPAKFAYFINGKVEKKELKDFAEAKILEGDILWTAFEDKYFTSAVIPHQELPHQVQVGTPADQSLAYRLVFPHVTLKPGEEKTYQMAVYLGPKEIGTLERQGSKLEKTLNFGMFDIIAKPLLISLNFFYRFCGNYGIAIILITVIIKILFWPLTHKSYQSMKDMQKLQPEMQKLKEKYKNKKDELNREIMALYKKYNVNPLGGCLPILLQIPVFIALYSVLSDSIELRHANFISFWINDLSAHDPTYISPLLMGASMFYQQKMTPSTADPAQAKMMLMMPIIFTFMFLNFPAGLVLYWLINNVLSIIQQLYINKTARDAGGSEWTQSKSKQKPLMKQS
jgi:YidC/Oxa1 family membrane protein insertase